MQDKMSNSKRAKNRMSRKTIDTLFPRQLGIPSFPQPRQPSSPSLSPSRSSSQNESDHLPKRQPPPGSQPPSLPKSSGTTMTPRTHRSTLSPTLIRTVCITLTSVSLGCALLGLGLTCTLLGHFDHTSAPCPNRLVIGAFGAAGVLVAASLILCCVVCRGRRRLNKEVMLEDLPCGGGVEVKGEGVKKLSSGDVIPQKTEALSSGGEEDSFDLTQVSFFFFLGILRNCKIF